MNQSNSIYIGSEISDSEVLHSVPDDYRRVLKKTNGSILFDGGLHIRGAVLSPDWHSLRNLKAVSMFDHIRFLADFAKQITDIPEGATIKIKVIHTSEDQI